MLYKVYVFMKALSQLTGLNSLYFNWLLSEVYF